MSYYSFEKGKHGGSAGYIFPYFTLLTGSIPDGQYQNLIPAGFLKCQGQVLNADSYRALASVIGSGSQCIYARGDVELRDPDINGVGGQIQLPDLGSKYIIGSNTPGIYVNTETSNPDIERAGISVEIFSTADNIDFFYTGDFRIPARPLTVTGNIISVSPTVKTEETFLSTANYMAHGHSATFRVADRINTNRGAISSAVWRNVFLCGSRVGRVECNNLSNFGAVMNAVSLSETGTEQGSTHRHFGMLPRINASPFVASASEVLISSGTLVTNVKVRTDEQIKMDEFAPKYILCEYLIKY